MDKDETQMKSALEFRKAISNAVHLPVLASGEAGKLEHYAEGVVEGGQVLLATSVFHCRVLSFNDSKTYPKGKGWEGS
jgi:imidazole glycerol-phosphate synthase subunit HisF